MNVFNKRTPVEKILIWIHNNSQSVFIHLESSITLAIFRNGDTQGHYCIWPISFVTSYKQAYRMKSSCWVVHISKGARARTAIAAASDKGNRSDNNYDTLYSDYSVLAIAAAPRIPGSASPTALWAWLYICSSMFLV